MLVDKIVLSSIDFKWIVFAISIETIHMIQHAFVFSCRLFCLLFYTISFYYINYR